MKINIAKILGWIDAGLDIAVQAGLPVGHVNAAVDAITRYVNSITATMSVADRETVNRAAALAMRAKGVAAQAVNDQLQIEFGGAVAAHASEAGEHPPESPVEREVREDDSGTDEEPVEPV